MIEKNYFKSIIRDYIFGLWNSVVQGVRQKCVRLVVPWECARQLSNTFQRDTSRVSVIWQCKSQITLNGCPAEMRSIERRAEMCSFSTGRITRYTGRKNKHQTYFHATPCFCSDDEIPSRWGIGRQYQFSQQKFMLSVDCFLINVIYSKKLKKKQTHCTWVFNNFVYMRAKEQTYIYDF